jgi:hypothetical protein
MIWMCLMQTIVEKGSYKSNSSFTSFWLDFWYGLGSDCMLDADNEDYDLVG